MTNCNLFYSFSFVWITYESVSHKREASLSWKNTVRPDSFIILNSYRMNSNNILFRSENKTDPTASVPICNGKIYFCKCMHDLCCYFLFSFCLFESLIIKANDVALSIHRVISIRVSLMASNQDLFA